MDSVFGDVKKIYGALQPALQDLAPSTITKRSGQVGQRGDEGRPRL